MGITSRVGIPAVAEGTQTEVPLHIYISYASGVAAEDADRTAWSACSGKGRSCRPFSLVGKYAAGFFVKKMTKAIAAGRGDLGLFFLFLFKTHIRRDAGVATPHRSLIREKERGKANT